MLVTRGPSSEAERDLPRIPSSCIPSTRPCFNSTLSAAGVQFKCNIIELGIITSNLVTSWLRIDVLTAASTLSIYIYIYRWKMNGFSLSLDILLLGNNARSQGVSCRKFITAAFVKSATCTLKKQTRQTSRCNLVEDTEKKKKEKRRRRKDRDIRVFASSRRYLPWLSSRIQEISSVRCLHGQGATITHPCAWCTL